MLASCLMGRAFFIIYKSLVFSIFYDKVSILLYFKQEGIMTIGILFQNKTNEKNNIKEYIIMIKGNQGDHSISVERTIREKQEGIRKSISDHCDISYLPSFSEIFKEFLGLIKSLDIEVKFSYFADRIKEICEGLPKNLKYNIEQDAEKELVITITSDIKD
jgi:hypothetical protein